MDINERINVMGVLNSINKDNILAEADQIEISNYDNGTTVKVPDAVLRCSKGLTADELSAFDAKNTAAKSAITGNQLFICTKASSSNTSWSLGHIYYYDAGTMKISDITPSTGGGSGGGSAVSLTVDFHKTEFTTSESITIPYVWTSSNTGYGTVYYMLDNVSAGTKRMLQGSSSWSLDPLKRGNHTLSIYVTDSANVSSSLWSMTISVGSLEISSTAASTDTVRYGNDIVIPYTIYYPNNDNLVLVTSLDSADPVETSISKSATSGSILSYTLSGLTEGNHTLSMSLKNTRASGTVETSNAISFQYIVAIEGKLYASAVNPDITIYDYNALTLTGFVTYLGATSLKASLLSVTDYATGAAVTYKKPSASTWANGVNSMVLSSLPAAGKYVFTIAVTYTSSDKTITATSDINFTVTIQKSELKTTTPVATGLLFSLSADGKSNANDDRSTWSDLSGKLSDSDIILHNFNYKASIDSTTGTESGNGWLTDSDGSNPRLLMQSGSYVEINCKPFNEEIAEGSGFTFDIDFSTEDILDQDARVASCYFEGKGFWISTEYATLSNDLTPSTTSIEEKPMAATIAPDGSLISEAYTIYVRTGPFQSNFQQNSRTHVTFVIAKKASESNETTGDLNGKYPISSMIIYVNGVLTNIVKLDTGASKFKNGQKIYLGCDNSLAHTGKCEIYHVRAYDHALNKDEILQNYISDFSATAQDELLKINSTDETSTSGLPTMTMIFSKNNLATMSKDNKVMCKIVYSYPGDNSKSFTSYAQCAWQGTSSLAYAVKNYKIKLYAWTPITTTTSTGATETKMPESSALSKLKYDLGNGIKESTFCLKADYMDSSHARNTGTAMFVSAMDTSQTPPQVLRPATRTTIYGYPIKLYIQTSESPTYETSGSVSYTDPVFYGIYNFNLDKSSNSSLGMVTQADMLKYLSGEKDADGTAKMNNEYPDWDCISFEGSANSDSTAGAFTVNSDDMSQNASIASDFEMRFEDPSDLSTKPSTGILEIGVDPNNITYYKISGINTDVDGYFLADKTLNALVPYDYDLLGYKVKDDGGNVTGYSGAITVANGRMAFTRSDGGKIIADDGTVSLNGVYSAEYAFRGTAKDSNGNYTDDGILTLTVSSKTDDAGITTYSVLSNESRQLRVDRRYSHLKKLVQWVYDADISTAAGLAAFRSEFTKHFDLRTVLDYYNIVFTLLLADNLGKNVMWDTYGPKARVLTNKVNLAGEVIASAYERADVYTADERSKYDDYIWYPHFYDMDTELGCDNSGNIRFDVDSELVKGVFNTSESKLWTKFRKAFASEILTRYKELRTDSADHSSLTFNSLYKYYITNQISKISESNYNYDMFNKYLDTEAKRGFIFMCHGNQREFLIRWLDQRLYFLDTFYGIGNDSGISGTVRVEYNDYATVPVTFNIKTYKPAYVKVTFFNTDAGATEAESGVVFKKVPRDATITFSKNVKTATDQEVLIYDAPNIKSFGDVSRYSPKTVMVSTMTHLTDLSVGSEEYPNPNLTALTLGNNSYLTSVKADYCTAMTSTLSLDTCNNIQTVSTVGSKIPYVSFNKSGCALQSAKFGSSTTRVDIENCQLLTGIEFQSMDKISTFVIKNCPKLLGTDMGDNKGVFYYNVLNSWKPTQQSTEIYLYGFGELADYAMLDACATICTTLEKNYVAENPSADKAAIQAYIKKNIYLGGEIDYLGTTIPDKYSTYTRYFPDLTVKYPNVTNVSAMFKNYKNLNSISQKIVGTKNAQTGEVTYSTVYYWTDPRTSEGFAHDTAGDRLLTSYDYKDMDNIASEIKERIDPFMKFTNMDEMFSGDTILEKILPDTFDHITDISSASTNQMFYNCQNLKYIECPRVSYLGNQMFYNCLDTVIFIPSTIDDPSKISQYAFQCDQYGLGKHQTVLFETAESNFLYDASSSTRSTKADDQTHCLIQSVRDARFGIKSYQGTTGKRALRKSTESCVLVSSEDDGSGTYPVHNTSSLDLDIYYFNTSVNSADYDGTGNLIPYRLIYDIRSKGADESTSNSSIVINNWNVSYSDGKMDYTSNPMHVAEMLRGSMARIDKTKIFTMAIPSMGTISLSNGSVTKQYKEEGSIARIFYPTVTSDSIAGIGASSNGSHLISEYIKILSVPGIITRMSNYFLASTSIKSVGTDKGIVEIGDSAFEDSSLASVYFDTYDGINRHLAKIGEAAFKGTKLASIDIPDSVISIGSNAYKNTLFVTSLHYSSGMTSIPDGCFAGCDSGSVSCQSINGFSPNITTIGNYAFDRATGLKIVQNSVAATSEELDPPTTAVYASAGSYHCYFACDSTHSKFLNYFTNLISIGDYAFRGVTWIKKIFIPKTLVYLGVFAFDPDKTGEYDTMLVWDKEGVSSSLSIGRYAFAGRQFCWYCNGYGGMPFDGVVEKTAFVPSALMEVGSNAFSCDTDATQSPGELKYMLVDAPMNTVFSDSAKKWSSEFVDNNLRTVWNVYSPYVRTETSASTNVRSLYFLLKDYTALYATLLTSRVVNVNIASKITVNSTDYSVTELIDGALSGQPSINNLVFGESDSPSKVMILGKSLFDSGIPLLRMYSYVTGGGTALVPETLETVGSGTPFKTTSWYKNLSYTTAGTFATDTKNGFVYLNGTLLGYKKTSADDTGATLSLSQSTTSIYDDAFAQETALKSVTLNQGLTKICDRAFSGCTSLESISFGNCGDTLTSIGSDAFKGCSLLKSIYYTKALTHVGSQAIYSTGITDIRFQEGCKLDSSSYPICPTIDSQTGFNNTITDLYIPESMGSFFSTSAATTTAAEFMKLTNVTNLVLGTTYEQEILASDFVSYQAMSSDATLFDPINSKGYIMDTSDTTRTDHGHYFINLRYFYPSYYSSTDTTGYDVVDIGSSTYTNASGILAISFRKINESDASDATRYYSSDINLSKISINSIDSYDLFRIIMAYDPTKISQITLSRGQYGLIPTGFSKFFGNRASITTTIS